MMAVTANLDFAITQLIPNYSPDDFGNDGDYYFTVSSARSGTMIDSRANPITTGSGVSYGPTNTPWQGVAQYVLDENTLINGTRQQTRDLIIVTLWDQDDIGDDDIVDIDPKPNSIGSFVIDLDLRRGQVRGPYGPVYNAPTALEHYSFIYSKSTIGNELRTTNNLLLRGKGNDLAATNLPDRVTGAQIFIQMKMRYFDSVAGFTDTDGDGLLDAEEGPTNPYGAPIPGSDPYRPDVYVDVDAMQGLAPLPLPPITGATSNPASEIVIQSTHHGLTTGATVLISGVQGNTSANGTFVVTRVSNNEFRLNGSLGNGQYTGGGQWAIQVSNPTGTSMDLVVDAFARAPITNSNGSTGVNLHLNMGNLNLARQVWTGDGDGQNGDAIGEDRNANGILDPGEDSNSNGILDPGDAADIGGLSYYSTALAAKKMSPNFRSSISRYVIFADTIAEKRGTGAGVDQSGTVLGTIGRSFGSAGFAITMGAFQTQFVDDQAAVFMHFLGQSLGLRSERGVLQDFLPNHPSVTNSLWTIPLPGLYDQKNWRLDYSRGLRANLDESSLDEVAGLGGELNGYVGIAVTNGNSTKIRTLNSSGATDINNNGRLVDVVAQDLNRYRSTDAVGSDILIDRNDWGSLDIQLKYIGEDFEAESFRHEYYRELSWEDVISLEAITPSQYSINDVTITEGNSGSKTATFIVSLDRSTHLSSSVNWNVVLGGTAAANDVVVSSGTLTYLPGVTSRAISISVLGDTRMEPHETFMVLLSNPTGNTILYDNFGLGTIIDDDLAAIYTTPTGPLDYTWGANGQVTTDVPDIVPGTYVGNSPTGSKLDSNGRLIIFGNKSATHSVEERAIKLVRYLSNGSLDPTFGNNGIAIHERSGFFTFPSGGAVYQSGPDRDKILVTGWYRDFNSGGLGVFIARFNLDGTLDKTFGLDGVADIPTTAEIQAPQGVDIAIYELGANAGKFLVVSNSNYGTAGSSSIVSRHNEDGSLDSTFGTDGLFHFALTYNDGDPAGTGFPSNQDFVSVNRILLTAGDKILLSGYAGYPGSFIAAYQHRTASPVVIRVTANGDLDATFGNGQVVGAGFLDTFSAENLNDIALLPDSRIVGVLRTYDFSPGRLVRFTSNGVQDFVSAPIIPDGRATTLLSRISVDTVGRVYVGGYASVSGTNGSGDFVVARFKPLNGTLVLDLEFDPIEHDGAITVAPNGLGIDGLTFAADGGLLAAGHGAVDPLQTGNPRIVYATNKYEVARGDLSVTMTSNVSQVLINGTIVYQIRVKTLGDEAVFPAIQALIPAGMVFQSLAVPNGWVYAAPAVGQAGTIIASTRSLQQSDGEVIFVLTVTLMESVTANKVVDLTVNTSSATTDFDLVNNVATDTRIVSADHSVSVGASNLGQAAIGEQVIFPICVHNRSIVTASHTLTAVVPINANFVSATGNYTYDTATRTITWTSASLSNTQVASYRVVLQAISAGYLHLTAHVAGPSLIPDSTPFDNDETSLTDELLINSNGLVSLWKADGNLTDANGMHGASSNGNFGYVNGVRGKAFSLNGYDGDGIASEVILGNWFTSQSYTIGMWINPQAGAGTFIENGPYWNASYQYTDVDGKYHYSWSTADGSSAIDVALTPNQWQYLTFSRDQATMVNRVYRNGVQVGEETGTGVINYDNPLFKLGNGSTGAWTGLMDEVSVFNRPLSVVEIQKAMNGIALPNQNPTISVNSNLLNVVPGQATLNSGAVSDPNNPTHCLLVYASVGTVTLSGGPIGTATPGQPLTWSWSLGANDPVPANKTVTVFVNDGRGGIHSITFMLNRVPTVANPIADTSFNLVNPFLTAVTPFSFTVPANTFADADADALTYTATLSNGNPLPSWLSFNPATRTFTGNPTHSQVGLLAIKVTASDIHAASVSSTFNLSITDTVAPSIGAVKIAGTSWATSFKQFVDPVNLNTIVDQDFADGIGYAIPTSSSAAQQKPLPWTNINRIVLSFSEPLSGVDFNSISVTGINIADYKNAGAGQPKLINVSYNSLTYELILEFSSSLVADRLLISIAANTVMDLNGNFLPAFSFQLNVLPGDVNQSGTVANNDYALTRSHINRTTSSGNFDPFRDVNGSGAVANNDATLVLQRRNTSLPNPPAGLNQPRSNSMIGGKVFPLVSSPRLSGLQTVNWSSRVSRSSTNAANASVIASGAAVSDIRSTASDELLAAILDSETSDCGLFFETLSSSRKIGCSTMLASLVVIDLASL